MPSVSTYLNFERNTEEAFEFYKKVFKTQYQGEGIMRMGSIPPQPDQPPMPEADKNLVMHVSLPLLGDHVLMGTDAPESMGFKLKQGNNVYINLQPDTRKEADRLFTELSQGGKIEMNMQQMFWGDYFGSFTDKFGVQWMINTSAKE